MIDNQSLDCSVLGCFQRKSEVARFKPMQQERFTCINSQQLVQQVADLKVDKSPLNVVRSYAVYLPAMCESA